MSSKLLNDSLNALIDLGDLMQTLRSIRQDQGVFDVLESFSSQLNGADEHLWLQIDGEASINKLHDTSSPNATGAAEPTPHRKLHAASPREARYVDVHARIKRKKTSPAEKPLPCGLCYDSAVLTVSRSGYPVSRDHFFCTPLSGVASLMEGRTVKVQGQAVGVVIQNSGGLLKIVFSGSCSTELIEQLFTSLIFFNPGIPLLDEVVLDWSFSCHYLKAAHQESPQSLLSNASPHPTWPAARACF